MQIQTNTDHNIEGKEALANHVTAVVEDALSAAQDHVTRVEVHLSDENSDKKQGKNPMRCMMEARLAGHKPLAVTHSAETLHHAIDGATAKLYRLVDKTISRSS